MRWIWIAIACAGCPAVEPPLPPADMPEMPPPPRGDLPLPPSNCALGAAPPITWCRQRHQGATDAAMTVASAGAVYVQDWTNTTTHAAGHVEVVYGNGFPIERHETGTFAGQMTTVCSDSGRVEIEHTGSGVRRSYFDASNRPISYESDADADGVFETRSFNFYDGDRLVRRYSDDGPGTPPKYIWSLQYDDRGRVHLAIGDRDGDGETDETQQRDWDDLDRQIDQITFHDNEEIERWTWSYEGEHLTVTEVTGTGPYRWTDRYDDRGLLIRTEGFDVAAQHLDWVAATRYDELDRPIEYDEDTGVDDVIDQYVFWEYCN